MHCPATDSGRVIKSAVPHRSNEGIIPINKRLMKGILKGAGWGRSQPKRQIAVTAVNHHTKRLLKATASISDAIKIAEPKQLPGIDGISPFSDEVKASSAGIDP